MASTAEYPRFVQRILEVTHPGFLTPIPATGIVQLTSNTMDSTQLTENIRRGDIFKSNKIPNSKENCQFSVTQDVCLLPMQIDSVALTGMPTDLSLKQLGIHQKIPARLKIKFNINFPQACSQLPLHKLTLFLGGEQIVASHLLFLLMQKTVAVICHHSGRGQNWQYLLPENCLKHEGFDEEQALNFDLDRVNDCARLWQEYTAFPQKFLFFSVFGIAEALKNAEESNALKSAPDQVSKIIEQNGTHKEVIGYEDRTFELSFLFDSAQPNLEGLVSRENILLHCAPVVNLFPKNDIRFAIDPYKDEHHVVIDRTQPLNYEVHTIKEVLGYTKENQNNIRFAPIYEPADKGTFPLSDQSKYAYFSARRENRIASTQIKKYGSRSGYLGGEVFLSLVGQDDDPISHKEITHLSVKAWCTNRDLPLLMPLGEASDFLTDENVAVEKIKLVTPLSSPHAAVTDEASLWHIINQLGLDYTALDEKRDNSAAVLRELISTYIIHDDNTMLQQIEAIRLVSSRPETKFIKYDNIPCAVRGVKIEVVVDEDKFSGVHPYLLGTLLNHFFARFVSINSFIHLEFSSLQKGNIACWGPIVGKKSIL